MNQLALFLSSLAFQIIPDFRQRSDWDERHGRCAFAQTRSTHQRQTATVTEQPIVVTGTIITATEEGSAANYQPAKTLVVREDRSNSPGSYVLNGPGHVVNKNGEVIRTAIKPGTHVRVYYVNAGDLRMVDHVVVD